MPKRVPVNTIILKRDGKNYVPKVGVPFDFTQEELNDINAVMPTAVRKIINEAPDEPAVIADTGGDAGAGSEGDSKSAARTTGRRGSRNAAQTADAGAGAGGDAGAGSEGDGDL